MKNFSDYLDNKLPEDASEDLTRRLVNAQIDQSKKIAWQQKLATQYQVSRSQTPKKNKAVLHLFQWRNIAAVFLIVAFGTVFYLSSNSSPESQAMVYLVEQKYEDKIGNSRGNATTLPAFQQALTAYHAGQYKTARRDFSALAQQNPTQVNTNFYLGLSHLYLKEYPAAITAFQQVQQLADEGQAFKDEANWFLGLAYTLSGQEELARQVFEKIVADEDAWNHELATQMLAEF